MAFTLADKRMLSKLNLRSSLLGFTAVVLFSLACQATNASDGMAETNNFKKGQASFIEKTLKGNAERNVPRSLEGNSYFHLDEFIVYLRYGETRSELLRCDVVLKLERGTNLPVEPTEIRKMIYRALNRKRRVRLRPFEMRKALQKDIRESVNRCLSQEIVRDVYFKAFVIL